MIAGRVGFFATLTTAHPEALAWQARVVANGGSVSAATLSAVSTFCRAIDTAGIRDRFYRLNLFCGTGLSACLVPLYLATSASGATLGSSTETNNNLVSGDYVETGSTTGGIKGDGSTKHLNTGLRLGNIGASISDIHIAAYVKGTEASGTSRYMISAFSGGAAGPGLGWLGSGSNERYHSPGVSITGFTSGRDGFLAGSTGSSGGRYYRNGSSVATGGTASGSFSDFNVMVLASGTSPSPAAALYSLARYFRAYSIGRNMTDAQWSAYNTAMQAFQTALTRNV